MEVRILHDTIKDYITNFNNALDYEIEHAKSIGGTKYRVSDGQFIARVETDYVYTFNLELELQLPAGSPIRLEINNKNYNGEIISCEHFEITMIIRDQIENTITSGNLYCEPWQLYIALQTRITEIGDVSYKRNGNLALSAISESRLIAETSPSELKCGQKTAVEMAIKKPVTFIWGPPGTGKTHTLAYIALKSLGAKKRVLVISHSNIAVDGAVERIYEIGKEKLNLSPGYVIRYGYPKKTEVRDNHYLTSFNLALDKNPILKKKKEKLNQERTNLKRQSHPGIQLVTVERELNTLRQEIREAEKTIVENARIVATSISKATVDPLIYEGKFDIVLLDEASMAYIPQAFFAASIARKHVVYIGDFRQLPPIALSKEPAVQKWLLQDIFEYSKVKTGVDNKKYHPWMVLLDKQRRMHPKISGFVSTNIYGGLLKDHKDVAKTREPIASLPPIPNLVIAYVNLSLMPSFCAQDTSRSRYNIMSAFVAVNLALQASSENIENSAAIITPYATQSRIIKAMLVDIANVQGTNRPSVTAATVHQFQGSENDVIVFDCVDSYRQKKPGVLLVGTNQDRALRLINVAFTRARGKFIALAHRGFWESKLGRESILYKMLNYLKEKGEFICGDELFPFLQYKTHKDGPHLFQKSNYFPKLITDITQAKSSIHLEIPHGRILEAEKLIEVITAAKKRGIKVNIRSEEPNDLPQTMQNIVRQNSFVWSPLTIIDQRICWYGYPIIKMDRVDYHPVIRFVGEKTSQTLISVLGISEKAVNTSRHQSIQTLTETLSNYIANNIRCSKCGNPMTLRKSHKGKPFLGCSTYPRCTETMFVPEDIVNTYLKLTKRDCPDCGYPFEAKVGPYGFYIRCMGTDVIIH